VSSPAVTAGLSAAALLVGASLGVCLDLAVRRFPVSEDEERRPDVSWLLRWHWVTIPALTALAFLLSALQFGLAWRLLAACVFVCVLVFVSFIDLERLIIPNVVVLPAAAVALAVSVALDPGRWWVYLVAAFASSAFLFVLSLIWPGGMGMGDVKLALLMGALLGAVVVVAFFIAFLVGAVVGLGLILAKRKTRKSAIPFGPFLALGTVVALLYGGWLLEGYLGLL
jgi:leader peptidase (prepilin peptidase)/N-methyltransferase